MRTSRYASDDSKSFCAVRTKADRARIFSGDLALSVDVKYHLVEPRSSTHT